MATSNLMLPAFPPFSLDEYSTISTRWRKYKKYFENLVFALNVQDGTQKKALLLNYLGDQACDIYKNVSTRPDETYDAVITLLDRHFSPQINITYERYLFQNLRQNVDENIYQFYIL